MNKMRLGRVARVTGEMATAFNMQTNFLPSFLYLLMCPIDVTN
jgi:hypothetical protein